MAVSSQQIIDFLLANPNMSDAEIASVMNQFGVSPADVATATGADEATIQARFDEVAPIVATPVDEPVVAPVAPPAAQTKQITTQQIVNFLATNPSEAEIQTAMETYKVSPEQVTTALAEPTAPAQKANAAYTADNVNKLAEQILSQGTTQKWTGGLAPETSARYMADELAKSGVTDISQVGQGKDGIINKVTGEKLVSGYGERTKGNLWSGSYEGKGNTGFGVQFDDAGKPIFYTEGASSSTLKKDLLKAASVAAAFTGLPVGIGEALGLTGATAGAVGGGLLSGGVTAIAGGDLKDIAKSALLGGGASLLGSTIGDLVKTPIDASGLTQAQFDASLEGQLVKDMQARGLTNTQISAFLDDMGIGQGVITPSTTTPTTSTPVTTPTIPEVTVTAPVTTATPSLTNVINAITTSAVPTVEIKGEKPKDTTPVVPSLLTPTIPTLPTIPTTPTIPEVTVTGEKPKTLITPITPIVPTVPLVVPTIPPTPPKPPTPPETPPKKEVTITDVIKTIAPIVLAPAVVKAVTPTTPSFPIVPIPPEWKPPTTQPTTPFQPLTPIDFGNQNLLKGTQWEKFLDPNYGKVPAPTQYSQPSNLSYNDLMGILGSKQGMPPTSSLSINDVISGIQNQYGQVPSSAVGQKPA
jgi:hypothetical protein